MFVGNCSGCFQVPAAPVYYWSPYPGALLKKPTFQISDILQVKNGHTSAEERTLMKKYEGKIDELVRNSDEFRSNFAHRYCEHRDTSKQSGHNEAINYSRKGDGSGKCSLPSALEPLQALCSTTPRVYGMAGPDPSSQHSTSSPTASHKDLKFGINRILAEDFGHTKQNKENSPRERDSRRPSPRRGVCECTMESCYMSPRLHGFPSAALSAVHALQPPKYSPHSPPGADTLPGPYSVLNTEVSMMGAHSKRKRSWSRAVFSNLQRKGLEKRFEVQKYVTKPDRRQLAAMLGLTDAQVKVWFQNRRMKWRHAQQQNSEAEAGASPPPDKPEVPNDSSIMDEDEPTQIEVEVRDCDESLHSEKEHSTDDK